MLKELGTSLRLTLATVVLFGLLYPFAMTGLAQAVFPDRANGSMIERGGKPIGSEIIGQAWSGASYFHSRPSAAGKNGYDPTATGGTNYGATSKKLIDSTAATIATLRKENPNATVPIPMDLVTSSASGIDPDISVEGALYQAPRVAAARKISLASVQQLIASLQVNRTLGILGEPHVNVLDLNLAHGRSGPGAGRTSTISSRAPTSSNRRAKALRAGQRGARCVPPTAMNRFPDADAQPRAAASPHRRRRSLINSALIACAVRSSTASAFGSTVSRGSAMCAIA